MIRAHALNPSNLRRCKRRGCRQVSRSLVAKTWQVSTLTLPCVPITRLLLANCSFAGLGSDAMPFGCAIVPMDAPVSNPLTAAAFAEALFKSNSQMFLKGDGISALLFLALLAVSPVAAAMFAVAGAVAAVTSARMPGAQSQLVSAGLLGLSPVLTVTALGTVFYRPSPRVVAFAVLSTPFTVFVQGLVNRAFAPLGNLR